MLVFFPIIPMFYTLSPRIQLLTLSDFIFLLFCYFLVKEVTNGPLFSPSCSSFIVTDLI